VFVANGSVVLKCGGVPVTLFAIEKANKQIITIFFIDDVAVEWDCTDALVDIVIAVPLFWPCFYNVC
jgi:hypothetical protein